MKEGGTGLLDLDSGVKKKINQQIHIITKHMWKKKKQRLTEKRNHTWCELGHDSRSGVKEGGTGLLDLDSEGSVCRCGVCHATRGRVGKGCGWLARLLVLKMKMVWESRRGIWLKNRRWINLVLLQSEWKCELCEVRPWGLRKRLQGVAGECLGLIMF